MTGAVRRPLVAALIAWGPFLLAAVAIVVLSWPFPNVPARTGLDPSWRIALHLVNGLPLQYGTDFVMTFGPLGFLGLPQPVMGETSVLAFLVTGLTYLALVATLIVEARRVLPAWAAVLAALVAARLLVVIPEAETFQALVFVWGVEAIAGRIPISGRWIIVIAGLLAGFSVLGKLNTGVFIALLGAVVAVAVARRWWRGLLGYALVAAATTLALWLIAGQRLSSIPAFVTTTLAVIQGYSEAMGQSLEAVTGFSSGLGIVAAFFVAVAALALVAWLGSADWSRQSRAVLAVFVAILLFAEWKTMFTRGEPRYAFPTLAFAVFAFAVPKTGRRAWLAGFGIVVLAFVGSGLITPSTLIDLKTSARGALAVARDTLLPGHAATAAERTRKQLGATYAIQLPILAAVVGHRVHIDPAESGVAFAYPEITWDPEPVFQAYAVWDTQLDWIDAAFLRGDTAPDRILRGATFWGTLPPWLALQRGQPAASGTQVLKVVDGRYPWFEAPAATLETFCRYRQLVADDRWQVLGRTLTSCGAPEPLGTVTATEGQTVTVPVEARPDRLVIVRVHGLEPDLATRLVTTLYKGPMWFVTIEGIRYRLVPGTAADGLLLAVPPSIDGTGPFAFGPPIPSLSIQVGLDGHGTGRTLTYEFQSVPLGG